ncbi:ScbA/BarX family gamma-butyrolactone biosynthesis protein [Streptomyces sp. CB01881]|uniref:ScbA/BarX family gamma-butyrolactone biosynthesis protein n=1 Tax=Streptomyces sp. CB01881 TaxID=2078691 RepID=UPI0013874698|nr:ScbA/BarX family gamma-butyrolactone biosynthesis protein [Streptomyces sp. CB01881]
MPLIVEPDDHGPYPHPGPGYDFHARTVSRHLVHRSAVSEVLITGWHATGPYDFLLGAQWPRVHGFYRLPGDRHHDPVLLAETVRQAGLLIGHVGFGVPHGHEFALDELCYTLGPAGLDALAVTAAPASLMLEVGCHDVRMRHGRLASLRVHAEIRRDGRLVGHASGQLRVFSPVAYARLRGAGNRPAGPWIPDAPTAPELVGRDRAADVVLGPSPVPGSWLLRADARHPVLFDRDPDHVPGMLVLEAARQAAHRLRHPERVVPVELVSSFNRFIELDRPCLVRAVREPGTGLGGGAESRRVPVRVLLVQDGRTAAECRLLTEPADGGAARRDALDGRPAGPDRDPGLPLAS